MTVLDHSRSTETTLEEVLAQSDFVSLHCPLTPETRHLINERTLAIMKPSAFLINTARGAIVDEEDLLRALDNGTIAGAALDVQSPEPPPPDSPLYGHPSILLTPHLGWKRLETRQRLLARVADNLRAFVANEPLPNLVN